MADHTYHPLDGSLDRRVVMLFGAVTIGATGAVSAQDCNGFSIARTGTGAYTIQLGSGATTVPASLTDKYPKSPANYVAAGTFTSPLLFIECVALDAGTRVYQKMTVLADTVATDGKITIIFDASANTAADPNSGSVLRFMIILKNSSTPRKGM